MKNGEYHLNRRNSCFVIDSNRNSAPVVHNGDGIVRINGNFDMFTESSQSLIHRIIHDFIDKMMQTSGRGAADIHARPLSDRFQTFQNLNLVGTIFCVV